MKSITLLVIIGLILSACLAPVQPQSIAAGEEIPITCHGVRIGNQLAVECDLSTPTAEATATATATETPTAIPLPTATTTPTVALPTPTPTITATLSAETPPFVGAPLCAEHDLIQWHSLWNAARGCHYNHTHNADPWLVADIFGAPGELVGQELSYPWQTPNELQMKATGYKYFVNRDIACEFDFATELEVRSDVYCVRAFRIQYHDHAELDPLIRFHSYFAEIQICERDNSSCWVVKSGGWADFGFLMAPYKQRHIPLPNDPLNIDLNEEPYRAYNATFFGGVDFLARYRQPFRSCKDCPVNRNAINDNVTYWATDENWANNNGFNKMIGFVFWKYDTSVLIADDGTPVLICPNYDCRFNDSEVTFYIVSATVPATLDIDRDGYVNGYNGYTDRQGNLAFNCTAVGLDCVPYAIEGKAKVGIGFWSDQDNLGYSIKQFDNSVGPIDFDVSPGNESPENEWWIEPEHGH